MSNLQAQDDSPTLLKLEHGTLEACGHSLLKVYALIGEGWGSSV